jgi:hypothetical protein
VASFLPAYVLVELTFVCVSSNKAAEIGGAAFFGNVHLKIVLLDTIFIANSAPYGGEVY